MGYLEKTAIFRPRIGNSTTECICHDRPKQQSYYNVPLIGPTTIPTSRQLGKFPQIMLCCISPSACPRLSQSQRQSMAESQSGFSLLMEIYLYSWHALGASVTPMCLCPSRHSNR
jgi:hypothetical protein